MVLALIAWFIIALPFCVALGCAAARRQPRMWEEVPHLSSSDVRCFGRERLGAGVEVPGNVEALAGDFQQSGFNAS